MRLRHLEDRYPGQVEIVHKSFILVAEPRDRVFTAYHQQHRQAAHQLTGLPFDIPDVGAPYPRSSFPALEAAQWVMEHSPEDFAAFDLALFEAFFAKTRDISDPQVIAKVARHVGIATGPLLEALAGGEEQEKIFRDYEEALENGIRSVPSVVIGGQVISGAVPYEQYEQALLRSAPKREPTWHLMERAS